MICYHMAESQASVILIPKVLCRGDDVVNPYRGVMLVCLLRSCELPDFDTYAVVRMQTGEVLKLGTWRQCVRFWYENEYHIGDYEDGRISRTNTRRA